MNAHVDKTQENRSQSLAHETSQKQGGGKSAFQFADNRPEAITQRKLQTIINNSSQAKQVAQFQGKTTEKSLTSELSQKWSGGEPTFQFSDNRPEAIAQRKLQEIANSGPQTKQAAQFRGETTENVVQLVEAGAEPIRVNTGDDDHTLTISGLINCVGVVIMVYGEGAHAFDHVAVIGGHFVTPDMFQFGDEEGFTEAGQTFIANINGLIGGIDHARLETTYYIKAPAVEGANPASLVQATTAATAIRENLGLAGQIEQVADNISISV